jgi:hypothetical protein
MKSYLKNTGWVQDDDLYWQHPKGHYNEVDAIFWPFRSPPGIHHIDTPEKIKNCLLIFNYQVN